MQYFAKTKVSNSRHEKIIGNRQLGLGRAASPDRVGFRLPESPAPRGANVYGITGRNNTSARASCMHGKVKEGITLPRSRQPHSNVAKLQVPRRSARTDGSSGNPGEAAGSRPD